MTEEEQMFLYSLLSRVPGKTAQQKLNYIQDWARGANLDLFGTAEQFVPEAEPEFVNPVGRVYGSNEGLSAVFNTIDRGIDPITAVNLVKEQYPDLVADDYNPVTKTGVDYMDIARQYAMAEADLQEQRKKFAADQATRREQFEAERPAGLSDIFRTKYDVMSEAYGQPLTGEALLEKYAGSKRDTILRGPNAQQTLFSRNPEEDKLLRDYFVRTMNKRLEGSSRQIMPTERGEAVLKALPFFNMGG